MSDEAFEQKLDNIRQARARLVEAADAVTAWMKAEGAQGNYRTNSQAPGWAEYEAARLAFDEAATAIRRDD